MTNLRGSIVYRGAEWPLLGIETTILLIVIAMTLQQKVRKKYNMYCMTNLRGSLVYRGAE